jgi:hypothetical protein
MKRVLSMVLILAMMASGCASRSQAVVLTPPARPPIDTANGNAQQPADPPEALEAWRGFMTRLAPGTRMMLLLKSGQIVRGTLLQADTDRVVISPRARVPEPVQIVALSEIASVELEQSGNSVAKSIAIGVSTAVGTFLGILLIAMAAYD